MGKVPYRDPHLKNPWPKRIFIALIIVILIYFLAPKIVEIYNKNLKQTDERVSKN